MITNTQLTEHEPNKFCCEISDLGKGFSLTQNIAVKFENSKWNNDVKNFDHVLTKRDADDDVQYWLYVEVNQFGQGPRTLTIFND